MAEFRSVCDIDEMRGAFELIDLVGKPFALLADKPDLFFNFRDLDFILGQFVLHIEIGIEANAEYSQTNTQSQQQPFHISSFLSAARNFALRERGFFRISSAEEPIGFFVNTVNRSFSSRKKFFTIRSSRL